MAKCPDVNLDDGSVIWTHCPSFPAAVLFAVLFFILTFVHIVQAFTFRKKFCWVLIMGGAWETAGFAFRAASAQKMEQDALFIVHRNFIILAPLWLNAFAYMVLARMIHFYVPEKACLRISARRLSLLFVTLDIVAFIVQASATGLMISDNPDTAQAGTNVYMSGIGLQECFILAFTFLAFRFQRRMRDVEVTHNPGSMTWRTLLYIEYASLVLISIRIIYRLIEFSQGWGGDIAKSEEAFYVLDALTMVVLMFLLNIFHPGRALVGPDSEFPKREKKPKESRRSRRSRKSDRDDSSEENQELNTLP